jgi:hypothetical protein
VKRRVLLGVIAFVVLAIISYLAVTGIPYLYLCRSYAGIHVGDSRAQVRHTLRRYHELRVPLSDVGDFGIDKCTASMYRYDLSFAMMSGESIHVAYDGKDRVVCAYDTYE